MEREGTGSWVKSKKCTTIHHIEIAGSLCISESVNQFCRWYICFLINEDILAKIRFFKYMHIYVYITYHRYTQKKKHDMSKTWVQGFMHYFPQCSKANVQTILSRGESRKLQTEVRGSGWIRQVQIVDEKVIVPILAFRFVGYFVPLFYSLYSLYTLCSWSAPAAAHITQAKESDFMPNQVCMS